MIGMEQSNRKQSTTVSTTNCSSVRRIAPFSASILLFVGLLVNKLAYERGNLLYHEGVGERSLSFSAIEASNAASAFWLPTTKQRPISVPGDQQFSMLMTEEPRAHVEVGQFLRKKRQKEDNANATAESLIPVAGTSMATRTKVVDVNRNVTIRNSSWDLDIEYHPPETPGAFLHIGKTGGSTLCSQLRNACHSWLPKPCGPIPENESHASLLTTYYHTPDFDKLPGRRYDFYVVSVRDPFDRFLSAYTYQHPRNIIKRGDRSRASFFRHFSRLYSCFPTLEKFAKVVGTNPTQFDYPNSSELNTTNCRNLARAVINQQVLLSDHFYSVIISTGA